MNQVERAGRVLARHGDVLHRRADISPPEKGLEREDAESAGREMLGRGAPERVRVDVAAGDLLGRQLLESTLRKKRARESPLRVQMPPRSGR